MFLWLLNLWLRAWFHDLCDIPDTKRKYQFPHWTMLSIYFWQERLLFFVIFVLQICCLACFPFGNYPQHFGQLYLQQLFLVGTIDWWDVLLYFHLEAAPLRHASRCLCWQSTVQSFQFSIFSICLTIGFILDLILHSCRRVWYRSLKLSR